jgi:hypothetical protein
MGVENKEVEFMVTQTAWPFRDPDKEDGISTTKRMVSQLLQRKEAYANLSAEQARSLMALGIEVSQSRDENTGRSMQEAARIAGLDPAFFVILEGGQALPEEITPEVLRAVARSVGARVGRLEAAMKP